MWLPFRLTSACQAAARSILAIWPRCFKSARISARARRHLPINRRPTRADPHHNRKHLKNRSALMRSLGGVIVTIVVAALLGGVAATSSDAQTAPVPTKHYYRTRAFDGLWS